MEKDTIIQNSDVFILNNRIHKIGNNFEIDSSKVKIVDGTNKYLMPGLADMHMHLWGDSTALRYYVVNGITSVKSMSGKPEYLDWAKQIESGKKLSPQLYISGPLMNDISFLQPYIPIPVKLVFFWFHIIVFTILIYTILRIAFRKRIKKHPRRILIEFGLPVIIFITGFCIEYLFVPSIQVAAEGEVCVFSRNWEVRKLVKKQKQIGYNSIKPYVSMRQNHFTTMLDESNKLDIPVVGHIPARVRIEDVIMHKMRGLAHVEELRYHFYKGYDFSGNTSSCGQIDTLGLDNITKRLQKAGIFVKSTIIACKDYNDRQKNESAFFSKPEFDYIPSKTLENFKKYGGLTQEQYPEKEFWLLTTMLKSCHKNGVMIVLGTDSQWKTDVHGFTVHEELQILVDNGFSNYEALETATKNAAISVNSLNEWGTIEEGKRADLLLLDENPLENINNTRTISGLILNGKWFDKIALDKILEDLKEFQYTNDRVISYR
ncbi:MAG TPA: amidohydrolase family protein [Brumimicrobium sp.]|nr:amidohydrolase family protein [Brumimicrobium sp.]